MGREFKYKVPGVIFYLFLLVSLILTPDGVDYFIKIFDITTAAGMEKVLIPVLSLGAVLLTSDGVGFIFVSIAYAVFNKKGGYSSWFDQDIKNLIIPSELKELYTSEQIFVSFHWYTKDNRLEGKLDDWVTRRTSLFFTNYASVLAIIPSLLLSGSVILCNEGAISNFNYVWFIVSSLISVTLIINAQASKKEALGVLNLFMGRQVDPKIQQYLDKIGKVEVDPNTQSTEPKGK